ncbi:MAG: ATP-binding protein [Candidatus Methanomethylophilaceae archaeon]|nr:ATP-binding protein [Candidatus Methanomethylophilaceae archaeon]
MVDAKNIPKRTLITMMNALSSGVVPRRGLEYIAVGRRKETETFVSDLADTAEGGGAFRFISGRFGNGKSFMTQMIRNYAMDRKFVVMDADLAINRRLTGNKREGQNTFMELVRNMAVRARPDGGALELILQTWLDSVAEETGKDSAAKMEKELRNRLSELSDMTFYQDFVKVVLAYWWSLSTEDEDNPALRWLKGEYTMKSEARRDLGVSVIIDDSNWYDFIKMWARFVRIAGYSGLVVFIDEGVILYKLPSKISRSNNYERLLTMFNDIMQGKSSYLSMYVCGTPDFIEDQNRGLYSYEALRSRLVAGRYENGYDNYLGPVINLRPLTNEEVYVLLQTLRDLYEQRNGISTGLTDEMLETYLRTVMSNSISSEMITPREITRDFISLMDTLRQNEGLTFDKLVRERKVSADINPDDILFDDLEI